MFCCNKTPRKNLERRDGARGQVGGDALILFDVGEDLGHVGVLCKNGGKGGVRAHCSVRREEAVGVRGL